jgi:hypothetical protein
MGWEVSLSLEPQSHATPYAAYPNSPQSGYRAYELPLAFAQSMHGDLHGTGSE